MRRVIEILTEWIYERCKGVVDSFCFWLHYILQQKHAKGVRVYGAHQQWNDPHCCVINGENDERDGC
jgi:hypothetical protein